MTINEEFSSLNDIRRNCIKAEYNGCQIVLLTIEWQSWGGFDGAKETIALTIGEANTLKGYLVGREIYFGGIAGKHSYISGPIEKKELVIIDDPEVVASFLMIYPDGRDYNHSFINQFHSSVIDDIYDVLPEEEHNIIISKIIENRVKTL